MYKLFLPLGLAACVLGFLASTGASQNPYGPKGKGRNQQPEYPPVQMTGEIVGLQGAALQVKNEAKEPFVVALTPQTRITVNGKAETSWLRAGLFVRLSAVFDKKGNGLSEVSQVEVLSPSKEVTPGVEAASSGKLSFAEEEKNEGKGTSQTVTGTVGEYKGGKMTVAYGQGSVKVNVADEARVSVSLSDRRAVALLGPGAEIELRGRLVKPYEAAGKSPGPGQVIAEELTATLTEPLTASGKKPKPKEEKGKSKEEKADAKEDKTAANK